MKNKEHKSSDYSNYEWDAEEANFVRKIKKGYGKYKGKLPFKCSNCWKVGHFDDKCPYGKDVSSDDEEDHNVNKGNKPNHHE